jgi:hypothetical protein
VELAGRRLREFRGGVLRFDRRAVAEAHVREEDLLLEAEVAGPRCGRGVPESDEAAVLAVVAQQRGGVVQRLLVVRACRDERVEEIKGRGDVARALGGEGLERGEVRLCGVFRERRIAQLQRCLGTTTQ